MEVYTSYHSIFSSLGFGSEKNYSALLSNSTALKNQSYGKTRENFCLGIISPQLLSSRYGEVTDDSSYTKLEQLSILTIKDVLDRSGITLSDPRTLLIYSTTKGNIDLLDETVHKAIPRNRVYLPEMAKVLAYYFKCSHEPLVISNACISGLLAIIIAKRFIVSGSYDTIVVCGGDLVTEFTVSGFRSLNALSSSPCRPFDVNRNGINLGEAVAALIVTKKKELITPSSMKILGGASANDANHISGPSRTGDGLLQAIMHSRREHFGIEIDMINAHGTATLFNDEMESIAFERAGLSDIPVNSFKGYFGHTLGAAGVLETILSIESATNNMLIRSEGIGTPGISGRIDVIRENQSKPINTFLKTASGFGGGNAAALFAKL